MPSINRRSLLGSCSVAIMSSIAGCANLLGQSSPPAGSLKFVNDHTVPHSITMRVIDVGSQPGEAPGTVSGKISVVPEQRELSASMVVEPGNTNVYPEIFTASVWYAVRFTIDGRQPQDSAGKVAFNPAPQGDKNGSILVGKVYPSGEFSWVISRTENMGSFEN
ncbi:MAG: hypothetical protein ABEI06_02445 [Halobacteriaceae archaeon]